MSISYLQLEALLKSLSSDAYPTAFEVLSRLASRTPEKTAERADISSLLSGPIAKRPGGSGKPSQGGPGGTDLCPPTNQAATTQNPP